MKGDCKAAVAVGVGFGVAAVEDRWYSPDETYFRVLTADGDRYVLCHVEAQGVWTLAAYRARPNCTKIRRSV